MTKGVIKENFHVFYLKLLDNYISFFICIFFIFAFCHVYLLCENEREEEEEGSLAFFFDEWILSDEKENKKTKLYQ